MVRYKEVASSILTQSGIASHQALTFASQMKIEQNSVVSLAYSLTAPDGDGSTIDIEQVTPDEPFAFLYGVEELPTPFEKALLGLSAGDSFDVLVPSAESGYGEFDEEMIVKLPREAFGVDDAEAETLFTPGNRLPMQDEDGSPLMGVVMEADKDGVVMDFNHPLTGLDLHFNGVVVEVRAATATEIEHGHVHGADGHNHDH